MKNNFGQIKNYFGKMKNYFGKMTNYFGGCTFPKTQCLSCGFYTTMHTYLPKDAVLAVEEGRVRGADEELRAVGVGACVGHRERPRPAVADIKILVGKLAACTCARARSEMLRNGRARSPASCVCG